MSRRTPSFDEARVAAAVTRALHAVADATPISPDGLAMGAGWRWMPRGPDTAVVVWRPAPAVVGTVVARRLSDAELTRLIDSIPSPQPFPDTLGPGQTRT